jgi:hypothetical protein
MNALKLGGWVRSGNSKLRHYCGAVIVRRGRSWIANSPSGKTFGIYRTRSAAIEALEKSDPDFWIHGKFCCGGAHERFGYLGEKRQDPVFTYWISADEELPGYTRRTFEKRLFGKAICARCNCIMAEIHLLPLTVYEHVKGDDRIYLACNCGYPVWRLDFASFLTFLSAHRKAQLAFERKSALAEAGGQHNSTELSQILALQNNRCIWCDVEFSSSIRHSRDHLLPVAYGGSDWAYNIVMACISCNSRRRDIPFRTYCKLLSSRQYRRTAAHMKRRLKTFDYDNMPDDMHENLWRALAFDDPDNSQYRQILKDMSNKRKKAGA